jgi:hypothetical protein
MNNGCRNMKLKIKQLIRWLYRFYRWRICLQERSFVDRKQSKRKRKQSWKCLHYRKKWLKPNQSWTIWWRRIKIWFHYMSITNWKNMISWYNIIPYYVPNNRWTIWMLNLMNGGSRHKYNSRRKWRKI